MITVGVRFSPTLLTLRTAFIIPLWLKTNETHVRVERWENRFVFNVIDFSFELFDIATVLFMINDGSDLRNGFERTCVQILFVFTITMVVQNFYFGFEQGVQCYLVHVVVKFKVFQQASFSLKILIKFHISP